MKSTPIFLFSSSIPRFHSRAPGHGRWQAVAQTRPFKQELVTPPRPGGSRDVTSSLPVTPLSLFLSFLLFSPALGAASRRLIYSNLGTQCSHRIFPLNISHALHSLNSPSFPSADCSGCMVQHLFISGGVIFFFFPANYGSVCVCVAWGEGGWRMGLGGNYSCNQRISSSRHGRCLRRDKARGIVRPRLTSI